MAGEEDLIDTEGGTLFKEDGISIVHKAAKSLTVEKESTKAREKLEVHKEKHRIYDKVLKAQKGLGELDTGDEGGVDSFLEKMRQAEKKARDFDSMDQEAEQEAKAQQKRGPRKKTDALTGGLIVGHSKDVFVDGTETILVLQDKSRRSFKATNSYLFVSDVLDDDTEEVLINPSLVDNERHKRNAELRKKKSTYAAYDEETVDEYGVVSDLSDLVNNSMISFDSRYQFQFQAKKKSILDKYDDPDGEGPRETFRLDSTGKYDLDREEQEMEMKRRLMMANKRFETLETPKYVQAREFYTEEEMLTFRKPKKKKDKLRKARVLKAGDLGAVEETAAEKAAK